MTTHDCVETTPGHLPTPHFAILFEGAWIFTPDCDNRIRATCPVPDDGMHSYQFGIWNGKGLSPVPDFSLDMPEGSKYTILVDPMIKKAEESFSCLFDKAAETYPFVYLPGANSQAAKKRSLSKFALRRDVANNSRSVSIPMPTSVRAAGALLSAEVGGNGTLELFGGPVTVKRSFVTFIFIYEYDSALSAEISNNCGSSAVINTRDYPAPLHLIIKVFPEQHGAKESFASHVSDPSDPSGLKVHAVEVFDITRRALDRQNKHDATTGSCCDIMLFHDQGTSNFDEGDTGLSYAELGLQCNDGAKATSTKFPACAGGGVVSGSPTS
jgi:hypothetical protein